MKLDRNKKLLLRYLVTIAVTAVVTILLIYASGHKIVSSDVAEKMAGKYDKLTEMDDDIDKYYLYGSSKDADTDPMYYSYVRSLGDRYTEYMSADDKEDWKSAVEGSYTGIGINVRIVPEGPVVSSIDPDGPAAKAGIRKGDVIRSVDGKHFDRSKTLYDYLGAIGKSMLIRYERDGKLNEVRVTSSSVERKPVTRKLLKKDVGYIRISSFSEGASEEFDKAVSYLGGQGATKLVIDIRDNGGGYEEQGIEIADRILPECTIAYKEDKNKERIYANSDESRIEQKYVLLVNENTASAAEIVAAAVKDNDGGAVIGRSTYGKGSVQKGFGFDDGSMMKLTVSEYYTPKGSKITDKGIRPDINVEGKKEQLKRALKLLE